MKWRLRQGYSGPFWVAKKDGLNYQVLQNYRYQLRQCGPMVWWAMADGERPRYFNSMAAAIRHCEKCQKRTPNETGHPLG